MGPKPKKPGDIEGTPSSSSTGPTTGQMNTTDVESKTRGEKRSLTSPSETGKSKLPDQKVTPLGKPGNSLVVDPSSDDKPGTSEPDSIDEAMKRMDGMNVDSSVDGGDTITNVDSDTGEDNLNIDNNESIYSCPPIKRQRVSERPSFKFQVIAQQINLDGSTKAMSAETHKKLDDALSDAMFNTIMAGPSFQMATGAKSFKNGKLIIGCDNPESVKWLENTIRSISFDGIKFGIWTPTFKGVKMSFFVKGKDKFPKDQVMELLQKQNNLLGKSFSVIRTTPTNSKDAITKEAFAGYIVTADVSKEFRDSALSKERLYLMTQVISPQFPSKDKPGNQVNAQGHPGGQGVKPKTHAKSKAMVYTLETMPSQEMFWTKLNQGSRRFFRKKSKALGKPDWKSNQYSSDVLQATRSPLISGGSTRHRI
jgi:hypothetical protein